MQEEVSEKLVNTDVGMQKVKHSPVSYPFPSADRAFGHVPAPSNDYCCHPCPILSLDGQSSLFADALIGYAAALSMCLHCCLSVGMNWLGPVSWEVPHRE